MPFKKGVSGNPAGRPPKSAAEKRFRDQIKKAVPEVIGMLIEQAKAGDVASARLLIERAVSPLRPIDQPVELPIGTDLTGASKAVLEALATGALTPGQAQQIAAVIAALARTAELVGIEEQLNRIETMLNEQKDR